ncbi:YgaP family membrane protein [Paenibacillus methanolicus]|uniref:YgaP family membrane protein n=1 Tax=Paenibacillus methanolicus TaxID=582686 RepID=UPI0011E69ACE|nr:DUF2892 domain-containing protein [Paenibacillus methanolicus]
MKNVGGFERGFRIILGLGILSLLVFLSGSVRFIGLVGIFPLWTGVTRFCFMNKLLGRNSCKLSL